MVRRVNGAPRVHAARRATLHLLGKAEEGKGWTTEAFAAEACTCCFHRLARWEEDCLVEETFGPVEHAEAVILVLDNQHLDALREEDYEKASRTLLQIAKAYYFLAGKRALQYRRKSDLAGCVETVG